MMFKDKLGNQLTAKEFISRWKKGIEGITVLQQIKTQVTATRIQLLGITLGLIVCILGYENLWWLGIILFGALINTIVVYIGLIQKRNAIQKVEDMFKLEEEVNDNGF